MFVFASPCITLGSNAWPPEMQHILTITGAPKFTGFTPPVLPSKTAAGDRLQYVPEVNDPFVMRIIPFAMQDQWPHNKKYRCHVERSREIFTPSLLLTNKFQNSLYLDDSVKTSPLW